MKTPKSIQENFEQISKPADFKGVEFLGSEIFLPPSSNLEITPYGPTVPVGTVKIDDWLSHGSPASTAQAEKKV